MTVFLSYSSPDKSAAESIAFSLRGRGYKVFLDRDDLPAGVSYDERISGAVKASEIFVFLISPEAIGEGRYTLTELSFARKKWPDPNGRVLPVMVRKTPLELVPPYLKAVTILEPVGNIPAETSAAVDHMKESLPGRSGPTRYVIIALILVSLLALPYYVLTRNSTKQISGSLSANEGSVTLLDGFKHYDKSGFSFAKSEQVSWASPNADILAAKKNDDNLISLFLPFDVPPYNSAQAQSGIFRMSGDDYSSVQSCPEEGYEYHWKDISLGEVFCVRTRSGNSFVKIKILSIEPDKVDIQWKVIKW